MPAISPGTLAQAPRRRFFSVRSRNRRSTWVSHDDQVGVKSTQPNRNGPLAAPADYQTTPARLIRVSRGKGTVGYPPP